MKAEFKIAVWSDVHPTEQEMNSCQTPSKTNRIYPETPTPGTDPVSIECLETDRLTERKLLAKMNDGDLVDKTPRMKLARDSFLESIASTSIGTPMGGDSPQYIHGVRTRNIETV